ncbi:SBBP repeat-containing protein [Acidobacteriota bacterium]
MDSGNYDIFIVKYDSNGSRKWARTYDSGYSDYGTDVAVDSSGNVFVAGHSYVNPASDYDFVLIKYDTNGSELWYQLYNGPSSGVDKAVALALDSNEDVLITGYSDSGSVGDDYATIKYRGTDGALMWTGLYADGAARYNGPGNSADVPAAIAVDGSDNVIVTGASKDNLSLWDYATVKYNTDGTPVWASPVRFTGQGSGHDQPHSMTLDSSGNIYVTGESDSGSANIDFCTIKYDPDGNTLWSGGSTYNGAVYWDGGDLDSPNAIAVDSSGNVYVAGRSDQDLSTPGSPLSDFAVVKYNSSGVEQWDDLYDGDQHEQDVATAIGIDGSDNIYVSGYSDGSDTSYDFVLLKYDGSGNIVSPYPIRKNGEGNFDDVPNAMVIDSGGNAYITGYSWYYGRFYCYTIMFDNTATETWDQVNGSGALTGDGGRGIVMDSAGDIYVSGYSYKSGQGLDIALVQFDDNGTLGWNERYNGVKNGREWIASNQTAIDGSDNIFMAGWTIGTQGDRDYVILKYNNSGGTPLAVATYQGPGNIDSVRCLRLDDSGNVYVTGRSWDGIDRWEMTTIKYDNNLNLVWKTTIRDNPGQSGYDIAVNSITGHVYVVGAQDRPGTRDDFFVQQYDASGNPGWTYHAVGPGNVNDIGRAIALDDSGNIYVTGIISQADGNRDIYTTKLDSSGTEMWTAQTYNGPGNGHDYGNHVKVDGNGDVFVAGISPGIGSGSDFVLIKYDTDGHEQWVRRYDGEGLSDGTVFLELDSSGNAYIFGTSATSLNGSDIVTMKYDTNGNLIWFMRYNNPRNQSDNCWGLKVDSNGNVYVIGSTDNQEKDGDFVLIKYIQY